MSEISTPAQFIRERVFRVRTQAEFADLLNTSQASISVAETIRGRFAPKTEERIRELARKMNVKWDDSYFFEVPQNFKDGEEAA